MTISRRSKADAETTWANLQEVWETTGLTFQASDIVDSPEDETRHVSRRADPKAGAIIMRQLPSPTPRSTIFSVLSMSGMSMPPEMKHFEHWSVEPDGAGSRIVLQTRFRMPLGATIRNLWTLWKQVGIIASSDAKKAIAAFAETSATPAAQRAQAARRPKPTAPPASYGREAMISLVAFAYLLTQYSWQAAIVLAGVILLHEYGHLLAYRLTGRRGNRLMLVPFFGGIAVASAPHRNQFEKAFCALMGPAICAPLTLAAFALYYYDIAPDYDEWLWHTFYFSAILNLLNLLPIFPLDGGQTAESFLRSFLPSSILVHLSGLSVAGLVVLMGYGYHEMAVFVAILSFSGLRTLPASSRLPPMSTGQALLMTLFYAVIVAAHGTVFYYIAT